MKIMIGFSGGVDSAVAAYLLKEQGHDVTCAFMRNWDSLTNSDILGNPTLSDPVCSQEKDWEDAVLAAEKIGLPLLRVDFIEEYWQSVFQVFLEEYRKGRTPNPDILCNRYIKFDSFLEFAHQNGFQHLATGHYARMGSFQNETVIMKAADLSKDQSYFLAQVKKEVFPEVIFPLAGLSKKEVRETAHKLGLNVADKKDSTGICFIGERNFREFLRNYLPMKPGPIIHVHTGRQLGEHQGVLYYTVGQRKGLNLSGGPFYVVGKDVEHNRLFVTDEDNRSWLMSDSCLVSGINWQISSPWEGCCSAKFRYRQPDQEVSLEPLGTDMVLVQYPQRIAGVTPGQQAVFYMDGAMLGGGVIETVYSDGNDLMEMIREHAGSGHV